MSLKVVESILLGMMVGEMVESPKCKKKFVEGLITNFFDVYTSCGDLMEVYSKLLPTIPKKSALHRRIKDGECDANDDLDYLLRAMLLAIVGEEDHLIPDAELTKSDVTLSKDIYNVLRRAIYSLPPEENSSFYFVKDSSLSSLERGKLFSLSILYGVYGAFHPGCFSEYTLTPGLKLKVREVYHHVMDVD